MKIIRPIDYIEAAALIVFIFVCLNNAHRISVLEHGLDAAISSVVTK